jgi:uncharacterized protein YbcI
VSVAVVRVVYANSPLRAAPTFESRQRGSNMLDTSRAGRSDGAVKTAVSDAMVTLLRRYTGRGATSARTTLGRDLIICVMGDSLTKGEKCLVQYGRREVVLDVRKAFQETMATDAIAVVEELSGRRVAAFMSQNHIDPDLSVETFVLQPQPGESESDDLVPR